MSPNLAKFYSLKTRIILTWLRNLVMMLIGNWLYDRFLCAPSSNFTMRLDYNRNGNSYWDFLILFKLISDVVSGDLASQTETTPHETSLSSGPEYGIFDYNLSYLSVLFQLAFGLSLPLTNRARFSQFCNVELQNLTSQAVTISI